MCTTAYRLPSMTLSFAQAGMNAGKTFSNNQVAPNIASQVLQAALCGSDNARAQKVRDCGLQKARQVVSAKVMKSALLLKSPSKTATAARGA